MSWSRLLSTGMSSGTLTGGPPAPGPLLCDLLAVSVTVRFKWPRSSWNAHRLFEPHFVLSRVQPPCDGRPGGADHRGRRGDPGAAGPAAAGPGALVDPNRSGSYAARGSRTRANSARRRSARSRRRAWRSPVLPSGGRRSSGRPVREGGRRTTRRSPTEATEDPKCAGSRVLWPAGVQGRPGLRPEEEGTAAEAVPEQGTGEDTGGWCILGPTPILGKGYRARFGRAEPERAEPRGPQ